MFPKFIVAIRKSDKKLVLGNGFGGRQQLRGKVWGKPYALFDLGTDISETNDIINSNQELADVMELELKNIIDSGTSKVVKEN